MAMPNRSITVTREARAVARMQRAKYRNKREAALDVAANVELETIYFDSDADAQFAQHAPRVTFAYPDDDDDIVSFVEGNHADFFHHDEID